MSNNEDLNIRVARYLKALAQLKTTTVRMVEEYERGGGGVLWFHAMPQEPDCRSGVWSTESEIEEPWVTVKQQKLAEPPRVPASIDPWVNKETVNDSSLDAPELWTSIALDSEEDQQPKVRHLPEHPEVQTAYDRYLPRWQEWAKEHRRKRKIQDVYDKLFSFRLKLQKQGEVFEIVLGLGLIDWHAKNEKSKPLHIRRHAVVGRAEIHFDAERSIIEVRPPDDGTRLRIEDDMIDASRLPERNLHNKVTDQLEKTGGAVWDRNLMHVALKTWTSALHPNSSWSEELQAQTPRGDAPTVSFAPALILRRRTQTGTIRTYEEIIKQLSEDSSSVPVGWGRLTSDRQNRTERWNQGARTSAKKERQEPEEIYFPLLANSAQKKIVTEIDKGENVLVQGPPGTGKSQTIANLVCHLLATGKRVLITAETSRALQVLKEKLPEVIRPLCVTHLGQDTASKAGLDAAVQEISNRQANYDRELYEERISEISTQLDQTRRRMAEIDTELRKIRRSEADSVTIGDGAYQGTASNIAKQVEQEREQYGWLKLAANAPEESPLTTKELLAWLTIRRHYTDEDVHYAMLEIPDTSDLTAPESFAALAEREAEAKKEAQRIGDLKKHAAYRALRSLEARKRRRMCDNLENVEAQRGELHTSQSEWVLRAMRDHFAQREAQWDELLVLSRKSIKKLEPLLTSVGDNVVEIAATQDWQKIHADVDEAARHLAEGKPWKRLGFFTPKQLWGRSYLKKQITVNGKPVSTSESLLLVNAHIELHTELQKIITAWSEAKAPLPDKTPSIAVAVLREQAFILERCGEYVRSCRKAASELASAHPPIAVPNWTNGEAQKWIELIEAAFLVEYAEEATCAVESGKRILFQLPGLDNTSPVVQTMIDAIDERDGEKYAGSYAEFVSVEKSRADQAKRTRVEEILGAVAPTLVETIEESINDNIWDERLGSWEQAWRWAIADAWLEKHNDPDYQRRLFKEHSRADEDARELIAESAAQRAWIHFFEHLTQEQAEALRAWKTTIKMLGKGKGVAATVVPLLKQAREYMNICRQAIPAWVMPRYLVVENLDAAPEMYDMIIVDEASQLGPDSYFLYYIAKQLVIVGDDQQISPENFGLKQSEIYSLQQQHLSDHPHLMLFNLQATLYGSLQIRTNYPIVLREHFRCMPEIIQFSNDMSYAPQGTPLDPLRTYSTDRLKPIVVRHVPKGYRQGKTNNLINRPEGHAIVDAVADCIGDERYKDKTIGVISLQGEEQAKFIEQELLRTLESKILHDRKILCGDARAFQGDERDIIFLSMVASMTPPELPVGVLARPADQRRFNVAASRAKDQLWLFHSILLDDLSQKCMRHSLLKYMQNPTRQSLDESKATFESDFERDVYRRITARGFHVRTQVGVGDTRTHRYRIDLVVEGMQGRLAVECDGDKWHGLDRYEQDMARQRDLERAGWEFERIRGSTFYRDQEAALQPLWKNLQRLGIRPGGIEDFSDAPPAQTTTTTTSISSPATERAATTKDIETAAPTQENPPTQERTSRAKPKENLKLTSDPEPQAGLFPKKPREES